jgi:hypothetical protein
MKNETTKRLYIRYDKKMTDFAKNIFGDIVVRAYRSAIIDSSMGVSYKWFETQMKFLTAETEDSSENNILEPIVVEFTNGRLVHLNADTDTETCLDIYNVYLDKVTIVY